MLVTMAASSDRRPSTPEASRASPVPAARSLAARMACVGAVVGLVTLLCYRLVPVNATTAGFAYLIAVLVFAAHWGLLEAVVASLLAVLCFNFFFFEPVGTFNIADPQNWVALLAFLATAMIASELSARARARTREAVERREEMEGLYALSRAILLTDPTHPAFQQIVEPIAAILGPRAVALYDAHTGEIYRAGPEEWEGVEVALRRVAGQDAPAHPEPGALLAPIRMEGQTVGGLAVRGGRFSEAAFHALTNLIAVGLERVRGQEAASRAEAARQSEELKSTLLDTIAHEFKTPLTSIKASASAMLAAPSALPAEQRELAAIVDEEANRLGRLVSEAIQTARLEAGKIQLHRQLCSVEDAIRTVLGEMRSQLEGRPLELRLAGGVPEVFADRELIRLALRHLVDNALRYSPPGSALSIYTAQRAGRVAVSVADQGPGIPPHEQARIFDKFYRSPHSRQHVTGSGMGLAISKEILEAHGGNVSVESQPARGSVFTLSLPAAAPEKMR
jgi:two-component system, OmpR family, sensor histidine kinase KdpD